MVVTCGPHLHAQLQHATCASTASIDLTRTELCLSGRLLTERHRVLLKKLSSELFALAGGAGGGEDEEVSASSDADAG